MPGRHFAVDVLEFRHAAHRQAVAVAGRDVVAVRLFAAAGRLEPTGQPVVRLGEPGLAIEQGRIGRDGPAGSAASSRRAASNSRANASRPALGVSAGRNERFGSKSASFPGGMTSTTWRRPARNTPYRLQPDAEIVEPLGVFGRGVHRDVHQLPRHGPRRRASPAAAARSSASITRQTRGVRADESRERHPRLGRSRRRSAGAPCAQSYRIENSLCPA